ncbi:hypothetical protein RHMOL_Rhmol07G0080200 [Rhododendron molle]|uniref:Uncharacterized protein n=1 Tax=Rhododendron molle TaxID=49168 RepID=A0ACC0N0B3_RHOML|nr:hypothetical protein RHMOL_Rhmol07G0080200 [Rhododendron molle]
MEAAAKPVIKVAALCGSLRKGSYNRGLLRSGNNLTSRLLRTLSRIEVDLRLFCVFQFFFFIAIQIGNESVNGMQIEYIDIAPLPMLNTDLEVGGTYPPAVEAFRQKILEADSVLFASPEYNYSVTGPLKNAIDWASRPPNVWANKAAAIVSAGGGFGGGRSQYHLRQIGVFLDLHFINKPEFFLNVFQPPAKFDSEGTLTDVATQEKLKEVLLALQAFTLRLQGKC